MSRAYSVGRDDHDKTLTYSEYYAFRKSYESSNYAIATNSTGYNYNELHIGKHAVLYWSPVDEEIKGIVWEAKSDGGWNSPMIYYVKYLFEGVVDTQKQLTAFNQARGKSIDNSSAGHTWRKKWRIPHRVKILDEDSGKVVRQNQSLKAVWQEAKKKPYDFVKHEFGIVNYTSI